MLRLFPYSSLDQRLIIDIDSGQGKFATKHHPILYSYGFETCLGIIVHCKEFTYLAHTSPRDFVYRKKGIVSNTHTQQLSRAVQRYRPKEGNIIIASGDHPSRDEIQFLEQILSVAFSTTSLYTLDLNGYGIGVDRRSGKPFYGL